jgi:uncharacterized protein (UPF0332 family)
LRELEKARLQQARESLDEAQALLAAEMDTGFVLTNLYYAYYYVILALMNPGVSAIPEDSYGVSKRLEYSQASLRIEDSPQFVAGSFNEGQVPLTMQGVTIGLFEQKYIKTGMFEKKYDDAIRRIFSTKPKCSGEKTPVSAKEVTELTALAGAFILDVETYLKKCTV